MPQFTCKAIMPIEHTTIHHDTATHTRTQRDNDKVFHAAGCPIGHFAHSCRIGIIGHAYRQSDCILKELRKRNGRIRSTTPLQIHCIFYRTFIIITIRYSYTYATHLVEAICLFHQFSYSCREVLHEYIHISSVITTYSRLVEHIATCINNTYFSCLPTYVYTYYIRFFHCVISLEATHTAYRPPRVNTIS